MRIGVVGCGVVGEATARTLEKKGHTVERRDPALGLLATGPFDVAFICVPTPDADGYLDTAQVVKAVLETKTDITVVRSTLPLGLALGADAVYMPCFAREAHMEEEEWEPSVRLYGGEKPFCEQVANLFGIHRPAIFTDFCTAVFTKLALNAKLASDISFATEMAKAAERFGVRWGEVAYVLKHDPRIGGQAYLRPGPFDGKCLPKDTRNLQTQTGSRLLQAVLEVNDERYRHEGEPEKEYAHGNG